MLILSNLGCQVLFWMGLMDQTGCDELRLHEENLDTLMWFKLLFVPSLGIVILVLFLLEEHCASFRTKEHDEGGSTEDSVNTRQRKLPRGIFGRSRARLKSEPSKVLKLPRLDRGITLNVIDEDGLGNVFKVDSTMTMKEVLQHYCEKHQQILLDSIILRYQGKRVTLSDTPEKLGITDSANIEMETDYMRLVNQLRTETVAVREQFAQLLSKDEQARFDSEAKNGLLQTRMEEMVRVRAEMANHLAGLEKEKEKLSTALANLENELQTHREARKKAEADRSKAERELETDKDLKEKRRLEKTLDSITKEVASIERLLEDAKRTHENGYKERSALRDNLADSLSRVESLEKELETWKQQSAEAASLVEKVEKMEKLKTETLRLQQRVESQTKDNAAIEAEIAKWQVRASEYDNCCAELARTRAREKAVEKEIERLTKWKGTILKAHEKESKETTRKQENESLTNVVTENQNISHPTAPASVSGGSPASLPTSFSSLFVDPLRVLPEPPRNRPAAPISGPVFSKIMPRPAPAALPSVSQYPRVHVVNSSSAIAERHAQFLQPLPSVVRPPPVSARLHQHHAHFQQAPEPPSTLQQHTQRRRRRRGPQDSESPESASFPPVSPVFSSMQLPPRSPSMSDFLSDFRPNEINHLQPPRSTLPSNLPQLFEGGFAAPLFIIDDHASSANKPLLIIDDSRKN